MLRNWAETSLVALWRYRKDLVFDSTLRVMNSQYKRIDNRVILATVPFFAAALGSSTLAADHDCRCYCDSSYRLPIRRWMFLIRAGKNSPHFATSRFYADSFWNALIRNRWFKGQFRGYRSK